MWHPSFTVAPIPVPLPNAQLPTVNAASGRKPGGLYQHDNAGLTWQRVVNEHKYLSRNQCRSLRRHVESLDQQLHQKRVAADQLIDEEKGSTLDGDDLGLHDPSYSCLMAQIDRIEGALSEIKRKSDCNLKVLRDLDTKYHSKFRLIMLKQLTASSFTALSEAANRWDDVFVPDDVIGTIWMFTRPFDELVELKFVVDALSEFDESGKRRPQKLSIQSHRGYDPAHYR